jgi:hypothetical protein
MIYMLVETVHALSPQCQKNKTHQFDMCQGQVGINAAKIQLIFLIASVLRKKTKK